MKTVHVSPENIDKKRKFQKPNILRKKPTAPKVAKTLLTSESSNVQQPVSTTQVCAGEETQNNQSIEIPIIKSVAPLQFTNNLKQVPQQLLGNDGQNNTPKLNNDNNLKHEVRRSEEQVNIKNDDANQAFVNIEAFFNNTSGENVKLYDIDYAPEEQIETIMVIDNKCTISDICIEENSDLITSMVPMSTVTSQDEEQCEEPVETAQNNYTFSATLQKYKCEIPNCKKEFRSEQKLQKHKKNHNEDGTIKPPRQVTVECPVKKTAPDGTEFSCGRLFLVRELLLKHLNEEHTPDDASYRCEECSRRFFWASGLRAHARAHRRQARAWPPGAPLVCTWSGCGRVFRQPCRLREHARAHTGDRPYHCTFPNCGWSFRSASKLERHARRHTGERRHACGECARAFLRREHLRDHHARHHAPTRQAHACAHQGCEQTFSNMSTLYMHMKKVHKGKEIAASETVSTETLTLPQNSNTFVVNLVPEADFSCEVSERLIVERESIIEDVAESKSESCEWRAARTHCTWPLPRTAPGSPAENLDEDFTVYSEQAEQSENSESNIYTVRSDLFLHGNVMINEDSEQSSTAVVGTNDALEADLGILDAHPSGDLMQEELMYTDVAADESSFRIFLLSGEELT